MSIIPNPMRCVVIRVEASVDIGLGHLMRCLALAQGLVKCQVRVIFALSNTSLEHCQKRDDWVGEIYFLSSRTAANEQQELKQLCSDEQANWLILDGYQFDFDYRRFLDLKGCRLAMFDDGQLLDAKRQDSKLAMVINWANGADTLAYDRLLPNALHCTGAKYRVLRREFYQVTEIPFEMRTRLIVTFGGSDPSELTLPLLQHFEASAIRLPITVITGSGYQQLDELERFLNVSRLSIEHIHDCHKMAEVYQQGRLAVSAAGGSQFELLHCAAPSILVVSAENQLFASEQASKQGWCYVSHAIALDQLRQPQKDAVREAKEQLLEQLVQKTLALWHQSEQLQNMHSKAKDVRQQNGLEHIYTALYPESPNHSPEASIDE